MDSPDESIGVRAADVPLRAVGGSDQADQDALEGLRDTLSRWEAQVRAGQDMEALERGIRALPPGEQAALRTLMARAQDAGAVEVVSVERERPVLAPGDTAEGDQ
jgi:hypothetical protein